MKSVLKIALACVLGGIILSPAVLASTTIGNNISTGGSLTADGALKFTSGDTNNYILTTDAIAMV